MTTIAESVDLMEGIVLTQIQLSFAHSRAVTVQQIITLRRPIVPEEVFNILQDSMVSAIGFVSTIANNVMGVSASWTMSTNDSTRLKVSFEIFIARQ
jgi:hypothetical protein